jgi:hypothetical protein
MVWPWRCTSLVVVRAKPRYGLYSLRSSSIAAGISVSSSRNLPCSSLSFDKWWHIEPIKTGGATTPTTSACRRHPLIAVSGHQVLRSKTSEAYIKCSSLKGLPSASFSRSRDDAGSSSGSRGWIRRSANKSDAIWYIFLEFAVTTSPSCLLQAFSQLAAVVASSEAIPASRFSHSASIRATKLAANSALISPCPRDSKGAS